MTTIDAILEHYREGRMTTRESVTALGRLITAENVADIMAKLPPDFAAEVERWAAEVPGQGGVVIGANLSAKEAQRVAEQERVARQAVRHWATRKAAADGPPNGVHPDSRTGMPA